MRYNQLRYKTILNPLLVFNFKKPVCLLSKVQRESSFQQSNPTPTLTPSSWTSTRFREKYGWRHQLRSDKLNRRKTSTMLVFDVHQAFHRVWHDGFTTKLMRFS